MSSNLAEWAKTVQGRLEEKVGHVHTLVEQKMDFQQKFIEQQLDNIRETHAEKLLAMSVSLENSIAEIRGYRDILQQQLTLQDNTVKAAHGRLDEIDGSLEKAIMNYDNIKDQMQSVIDSHEESIKSLQTQLDTILKEDLVADAKKAALQEDPVRKFLSTNGQKILVFVLGGIGLYLLRNFDAVLRFLTGGN